MEPRLSRTAARKVQCPACEAAPGERCKGARHNERESNHRERVEAAEAAQERQRIIAMDRDWNAGLHRATA